MITPDRRQFVRVSLATSKIDGDREFADLLPSKTQGMQLGFPVLSSDQLAIYFRVYDRVASPTGAGLLDGIYSSTRTSTSVPFPPGTRLGGPAHYYEYVTGESADHRTLFMAGEFKTHVVTRTARDEMFNMAIGGTAPAIVAGWRAIPSSDCSRLYTTDTPGGCAQEDIVVYPAFHKPPMVPYDPNAK